MEEARPLKNGTIPIDDDGHYIVTLDVFHQLHCLVCCSSSGRCASIILLTDTTPEQNASEDLLEYHEPERTGAWLYQHGTY
jgi:hypothetical protein